MSKPETIDIATKAVLHEKANANFAEILNLWLSLVYDTAYLAALNKHQQSQPLPPNTLPAVPLLPKNLPREFYATINSGCYLCGLGAGGKVTGYVCVHSNCPTRTSC
jgi:hypothetical protein